MRASLRLYSLFIAKPAGLVSLLMIGVLSIRGP